MFGLFHRKKENSSFSISKSIIDCRKQGAQNLGIQLWIGEQILFQVMLTKHMAKYGLLSNDSEDMCIVHFFNKNKTNTLDDWSIFKGNFNEFGLSYREDPKGVHFCLKNIGNDPMIIENEILAAINLYQSINKNDIRIEYSEW